VRAAVVLVLALGLAACGSSEAEPPAAAPSASGEARLAGTSLDGEPISLDDFRGTAVLVNVWSSW
jgi:hypothetical protein